MSRQYASITKFEEDATDGTLLVWGTASSEARDNDGELIKADAMRAALPDYMVHANIREMHSNIAAGSCLSAEVLNNGDTYLCTKIYDEGTIKKVKGKVLKGFSIGGNATSRDKLDKTIITGLKLTEISLVDRPANPAAQISLWKSDMPNPNAAIPAITGEQLGNAIDTLVKDGGMTLEELHEAIHKAADVKKRQYSDDVRKEMAKKGEALPDGSYPIKDTTDLKNAIKAYGRAKDKDATKAHIEKRAKDLDAESELPADWKTGGSDAGTSGGGEGTAKAADGGALATTGDPTTLVKGANADEQAAAAAASAAGTGAADSVVKVADDPSKTGAPNAFVMQGGSNVQAPVTMLPKPMIGDLATIKFGEDEVSGEIIELTEGGAFKMVNGDAWLVADSSKLVHHEIVGTKSSWTVTVEAQADYTAAEKTIHPELKKMMTGEDGAIRKGLYAVSDFASILQSIYYLQQSCAYEAMREEDGSAMPASLVDWLRTGSELLLAYVKEEVAELFTGVDDPDKEMGAVLMLAADSGMLQKFAEAALEKRGARNNKDDAAAIQKMHDISLGMGASCTDDGTEKHLHGGADALLKSENLSKMISSAVEKALQPVKEAHVTEVEALKKSIKTLEDMPMPTLGVLRGGAVTKGAENGSEESAVAPVVKNGKVDDAATAFKKAFANPIPVHDGIAKQV